MDTTEAIEHYRLALLEDNKYEEALTWYGYSRMVNLEI